MNKKGLIWGFLIIAPLLFFALRKPEPVFGDNSTGAKWFIYDKFTGLRTKQDPSAIADSEHANGQNTIINDGDRISVRDFGNQLFPSVSTTVPTTTEARTMTLHTFRKRNGEEVLLRAFGTFLQYFEAGAPTPLWEDVTTTLTNSTTFGYADNNVNTDQTSYVYAGNSVDPFLRWNGAHTITNGAVTAGATTITVQDTTEFNPTGAIIYCDTVQQYTSKTLTTFTVSSAVACPTNRGVAQAMDVFQNNPRGNIYQFFDNRLFIAGVSSSPQVVTFSAYGSSTQFVTSLTSLASLVASSTSIAPALFNLAEGGGAVTGMAQDEKGLYIFKKSLIYIATINDNAYTLAPLKPFDGKSQAAGAINSQSIFGYGNSIFFITPDNQIMSLTRVAQYDYPQAVPISDPIKPLTDAAYFASSTGIVFRDHAYISAKQSQSSFANDVVFVWNIKLQAWESPIIGWNVNDFAIQDDQTGAKLYFAHASLADTYKVINTPQDDQFGFAANWRSKQFNFNLPAELKEIDNVFVDGYILDSCTLNVSLLLDENGFTQIFTTAFAGTESSYLFNAPVFNRFGLSAFGFQRFGSNANQSGRRKFRMYLNKNLRRVPFYNAQIDFASDGANCQWEVERFGFSVLPSQQTERRSLYRIFQ